MPDLLQATPEMAIEYARWLRRAYTLQSGLKTCLFLLLAAVFSGRTNAPGT
jgi:hypothetical protein